MFNEILGGRLAGRTPRERGQAGETWGDEILQGRGRENGRRLRNERLG